jgi:hypothetical protein
MTVTRVADMNSDELLDWARSGELQERDVLDALRNPHCTVEVAEIVANRPELLGAHTVRELLASFRGLPFARAMDLIATLPWPSLLALAQSPRTLPMVGRHAEKKLVAVLGRMSLGEKVALARRAHRPLLRPLIEAGDRQVLAALLDNPRLSEEDVLLVLNTVEAPPQFYGELARHHRWGQSYALRAALVRCRHAPLPVALSALVQLRSSDLEAVAGRPDVPEPVRAAAVALREKEDKGLRRVVEYLPHDSRSAPAGCES